MDEFTMRRSRDAEIEVRDVAVGNLVILILALYLYTYLVPEFLIPLVWISYTLVFQWFNKPFLENTFS